MRQRWRWGSALLCWSLSCSAEGGAGDGKADLGQRVDLSQPVDLGVQPDQKAVGDSLPRGAISFFNQKVCPLGWAPFAAAAGRTMIPTVGQDPVGGTQGSPLDDTEDRQHGHEVKATLQPSSVHYAGVAGESNHSVASAAAVAMTVAVSAAPSGLPYVQLLACQKMAEADPAQKPAPSGLLLFFAGTECPSGWLQGGLPQGRLLIGVPEGGTPGQKFGGKPLSAKEQRTHKHKFAGHIATSAHGIALASGGLAGGYAHNDKYAYEADSEEESAALPYVQLLQCQKM